MNRGPWLTLIALGLIACWLQSCSHAPVRTDPLPTPAASMTPVPEPALDDATHGYLKYLPGPGATLDDANLVKRIEVLVNQIVQGSCIDQEAKAVTKLNETQDTPAQVVATLRKAHNDMIISYYRTTNPWSSAVAYRQDNTLYFNTRKIGSWSECDYASTALHETSHVLGYDHAFNYYPGRELTAPYWLNTVADHCCPALAK